MLEFASHARTPPLRGSGQPMRWLFGKGRRWGLVWLVVCAGVGAPASAAPVWAQSERAPQPFNATLTGTFSDTRGGVRFRGSGTAALLGQSTATMLIGAISSLTGCQTGQGTGSFVSKAGGQIDFVTVETSCAGQGSKGRDLDTGYFVIVGGKGAYQGAAGWGTFVGNSTIGTNRSDRAFTGELMLRERKGAGTRSPTIQAATGPFAVRVTGRSTQKGGSAMLRGKAHGGKLDGSRFTLRDSLSSRNQKWTGCLFFRAHGSFRVVKKGNVPFIAAGYSCGLGKTHTESGYWIVNGGGGRYTAAQGRGTFSGPRSKVKAGTFKLSFRGTMRGV